MLPLAILLLAASAAGAQGTPFTVLIDAAHGGADRGVLLNPQLAEKSFTLQLSVLLRSALTARGMRVVTTRENDADPSADERAGIANHAAAQACVVLHATASGSGVHLYTTSLSPKPAAAAEPAPWATAGAAYVTRSLKLSSDLSAAFLNAGIPYTLGRVRLAPLESMQCPAVAVEVAPLRAVDGHASSSALSSTSYQQQVVDALAAGLMAWRAQVPGGDTR